jgi:hypothetical protein
LLLLFTIADHQVYNLYNPWPLRVTHLKGTVKRKELSCDEKQNVSHRAFRYHALYHCRSFILSGVTHLKGTVKRKELSCDEKQNVSHRAFRYHALYHCRSFILSGVSSSLHQSPIWIKVIGTAVDP